MTQVDTDTRLEDGEHVVVFYENDDVLVSLACEHIMGALGRREAVAAYTSAARRDALVAELAALGVDAPRAEREGDLVFRDAGETLQKLVRGGAIDSAAFDELVADVVANQPSGRPVLALGEMVAMLARSGDVPLALELERQWDGLRGRVNGSILCAYPESLFAQATHADDFGEVCRLHSTVIGGAPTDPGADVSRRFPYGLHSPAAARRWAGKTLRGWGFGHVTDDCVLIVAELATNAVVHARSNFTLSLTRRPGSLRIAIGDSSSHAPRRRRGAIGTDAGGRGLQLVSVIATQSGHDVIPGGKLVWAELTTT